MKQETILRITGVGSAVATYLDQGAITAAINAAFAKTDPVYTAVEVETTEGTVYFRRPKEGHTYGKDAVAAKFSDKQYYADRERVGGGALRAVSQLRGKYRRGRW